MIITENTAVEAGIEIIGAWDENLPPVTMDSRSVESGDLFWALAGGARDGHEFIPQAVENGAGIIAAEKAWVESWGEKFSDVTMFVMEDTMAGLQSFANEVRKTVGAKVIGITGSRGKTTTREMVTKALSSYGKVAQNPGNYNNHIGVPLTLLNIAGDEDFLVIEMGANHIGEIELLCHIAQPDMGLIINIAEAHLEGFGGIEGVQKAKGELFEYLKETGLAIVNLDDFRVVEASVNNIDKSGFTLGEWPENWRHALYAGSVVATDDWSRPTLAVEGMTVRLNLPGKHFASGAMAAYAVAIESGAEPDLALKAIAETEPMKGRGNIIELARDVQVLDETYNASIPSIESSLETLANRPGAKVAILGDCLELGEYSEDEHKRLGRSLLLNDMDYIYLVGENMRWTAEEAELAGISNVQWVDLKDTETVLENFLDNIEDGTSVLVKGSRSMKMEHLVGIIEDSLGKKSGVEG